MSCGMVWFVQTFNWKYLNTVWGLSVLSLSNLPLTAGQGGGLQESISRPICDLFLANFMVWMKDFG